jgi:hypothetical protein
MGHVTLSPNAERIILEQVVDDWLFDKLIDHLRRIAEHPTTMTEPAVSPPYPPGRLMSNFHLEDSAGELWTFVVLLKRTSDEEGIYVTSLTIGGPDYRPYA